MKTELLTEDQKQIRKRILEISYKRKLSHIGSCLTSVDLIHAVYKVKENKDKFVLSNGHAGVALYAVLEKFGIIERDVSENLHVHPDRNSKYSIDVSTGSLGQGLPIAVGLALADRNINVYCVISDGECAEGSIWESFRLISENKLRNIKILLNANGWGAYGQINLNWLLKRLEGFNLNIVKVDGHNIKEIEDALKTKNINQTLLIFAKTDVEQLPFLKGLDAHYYVLKEEDIKLASEILK